MNIYWGDIHNHCGITYGYGALENALKRAKSHLDFCAVTGHAMWPDMYERTEETAFVVDFHKKGFQKLYDHWDEVRTAVAAANSNDLVTFQAYEMHSSEYGDHHIVTPDDSLPLIYRSSPAGLLKDCGCDGITVAHHIGYTPGYRGIDWDKYDPGITPLIEVCSKHGCAMSETAAYPYYHNMGPRDSQNTVFEGLRRGYRFGFAGSTDHHAGYPGSYGDGKMAVLAEEKNRKSIWKALKNRHTYAVTGDRIKCGFDVNGHIMGSISSREKGHAVHYSVKGCYPIDKIPSAFDEDAQDSINDIDNQILSLTGQEVRWQCFTLKNPSTLQSQTDAIILELEGGPDTAVEIDINGQRETKTIEELCAYGYSAHMKPYHSQAFKVHTMISSSQYEASKTFLDEFDGPVFYHMEVSQQNNQWAYVSPVYFD